MSEETSAAVDAEETAEQPEQPAVPASPSDPSERIPFVEGGRVFDLPAPALLPGGAMSRVAEVVKMKGDTRQTLAKKEYRADFAKSTDLVLSQCLKRLGSDPEQLRWAMGRLPVGSRDAVMMEARRLSMGAELTANLVCRECKSKVVVEFNLDEIPMRRLEEGDFFVRDDYLCFRIDAKAIDGTRVKAACRFPVGSDQHEVLPVVRRNEVESNYRLYALCLLEWNGEPAGDVDHHFFGKMDVDVLDAFEEAFSEAQPGPIFEQEVPCPGAGCGVDISFTFEGSDFLFRPQKRGKR